jgi:serine/threonine protein kinase
MFACCFHTNNQVNDVNDNKKESNDKQKIHCSQNVIKNKIKKIKKELFKTKINNHIGYGISSNIFKIKLDNTYVSCKVIKDGWVEHSENEICVLKKITNIDTFFVKYICNFNLSQKPVICYEYIDGTDLFTYISKDNTFLENENKTLELIRNILFGLEKLMELDLVHLDVKPENIIIQCFDPLKIKIIDLAFCYNYKKRKIDSILGTIGYMAPEIVFHKKIYHNTDIWSIGIMIYLLYSNTFMFDCEEDAYVYNITCDTRKNKLIEKNLQQCSVDLKMIITKCLMYNTNYRISVNGLIKLLNNI